MFGLFRIFKPSARLISKIPSNVSYLPLSIDTKRYFSSKNSNSNKSSPNDDYNQQSQSIASATLEDLIKNQSISYPDQQLNSQGSQGNQGVDIFASSQDLPPLTKEQASHISLVLFQAGQDANKLKQSPQKALQYYSDCLHIIQKYEIDDHVDPAVVNSLIGYIYLQLNDLDNAINHLNQADQLIKSSPEAFQAPQSKLMQKYYLALFYEKREDTDKAISLLEEITKGIRSEDLDLEMVVDVYESLGKIYSQKKQGEKAVSSWKKGVDFVNRNVGQDSPIASKLYKNLILAMDGGKISDEVAGYAKKWISLNGKLKDDEEVMKRALKVVEKNNK